MPDRSSTSDPLFLRAEQLADDFSLFPERADPAEQLQGLVDGDAIAARLAELQAMDVDAYIAAAVRPCEDASRLDARRVLRRLKGTVVAQGQDGPLYWCELDFPWGDEHVRRIGVLAQSRAANNGAWMPQHHRKAVEIRRAYEQLRK